LKAVILAAGEGTRLRPYTETMPKVMLPVGNKPILEYVFDAVKNSGIEEIILIVGYKKEVIMEYFKNYKGIKITYIEQEKQLGTAHALMQAKSKINEPFLVLSGDNIIDRESILKLIKDKSEYSLLIKENPYPSKYGVVLVEKNILKEIIEKPKKEIGKFISTGIYKLPKSFFKDIKELSEMGVFALTSVLQKIINQGKTVNTITANLWMDIVYPWDLINVNETIIKKTDQTKDGLIEKNVTIKGEVYIGKNTKIYSGCYIVGPVVIGDECEIGPNTCIFPSTSIGNNTVISPFSEIRNSVIMNNVHIGSNSFIDNSIIGRGTTISNKFSATSGQSTVEIEGEYKQLQGIGAMIGEDCLIGSNVVIDPGLIIGRKTEIEPIKRIIKNIKSQSKVM